MSIASGRVLLKPSGFLADGNAIARYAAERAAWIWHPAKSAVDTAILRFRLRFDLEEKVSPLIHVTADQRFQLRCDGRGITFGPDRCDIEHWTFHTVRLDLEPGAHEFEVLAWWIVDRMGADTRIHPSSADDRSAYFPPMGQISWRGGFLFAAEGVDASLFNTGAAPWVVDDLSGAVQLQRSTLSHYNDVGPCFSFDLDRWQCREGVNPAVVMPPLTSNCYGVRRPGWCLYPAEMPEQRRESWNGGRIVAFRADWEEHPYAFEDTCREEISSWQELIDGKAAVTIPPHSRSTVLWDQEAYHCGYPAAETEGGAGSVIEWNWAESLYEAQSPQGVGEKTPKGNRNQVIGKVFAGMEDRWHIGSAPNSQIPSLWWRSGRYVQLRIETGAKPLVLRSLGIHTTGYPLEWSGKWRSSDASWDELMPLFESAYRASGHEVWTDTPYYEQLGYVGDTLLDCITNYAWCVDDRLSRRAIRLFEWSRHAGSGLIAERYPSQWRQECPTFSLLWPTMVRDFAWWRDDPAFVKEMLPGIRSVLAEFDSFAQSDGLLHQIPGWPWIDWVPEWSEGPLRAGCGPGVREGDSCIVNLLWVRALLAAAQIEEAHGDPLLMERDWNLARGVFDRIVARYWDELRGMFRDTCGSDAVSEHAQFFAILTGLLDSEKTGKCLAALCKCDGLAKATIGVSFYLLDALYRCGEAAEFFRRLEFWRALPVLGFTSTPEGPEPSRSDAHAWGAHPAWHTLASIAGVRPDAPGFAKVRIAPMPGPLGHFEASVVHPRGAVGVAYQRTVRGCRFIVRLPESVAGTLLFRGQTYSLTPGVNEIAIS